MKELTLKQIADWCGGTVAPEYETVPVTGVESDSRKVEVGDLFVALRGERVDGHDFIPSAKNLGASAALVSRPSEELPCVVVESPLRAYGEIAKHYREMTGVKVVGITGSVGKTTTKEMIASVLSRNFKLYKSAGNHNNDIGLPMTVMDMPEDTELLVAEMGTNHPGEIAYLSAIAQPDYAVITNIGIAHIEYLGSREGILREKLDILRSSLKNTVGIFNGDEPLLWNVRDKGTHKKYYFGIDNPSCDVVASGIQELDDGMRFHVRGFHHEFELFVPALGRHMVYNALAAVTVGLAMGVKPETIQNELSIFRNTGMRQKIYEKNGMTIIEDCYNAGPESTEAALGVLASVKTSGKRIAVLGDMLELGNRSSAEHYRIGRIAAQKADLLLTYGAHSVRTVTGAITGGMSPKNAEHFDTHEDLVRMLKMRAGEADVILFKGSRGMKMERVLQMFLDDHEA